ncbi:RING finger protein 212B [Corapipo altera]|uniref:RING finger protein 212B n=1 Tax=Corapipo altera TaxID=415028 RepID=UPI000FD63E8A|nr:RING finger protein 212B [Corapipo altera]
MDWFHCNRCYRQEGTQFAVTSCGHILCQDCGGTGPCPVCSSACRYLSLSHQMRPQDKLFFKSPASIAIKHLSHISQVWRFQMTQVQLLLESLRDTARRAQAALEEAKEELAERRRQVESLRRENAELRRAQLSPGWLRGSRSSTPRPIGITSPSQSVTPQPRRQLSGQVVSRSAPLEPPQSRSTPIWQPQVGGAYRESGTPVVSSVGERPQIPELLPQNDASSHAHLATSPTPWVLKPLLLLQAPPFDSKPLPSAQAPPLISKPHPLAPSPSPRIKLHPLALTPPLKSNPTPLFQAPPLKSSPAPLALSPAPSLPHTLFPNDSFPKPRPFCT